MKKILFVISILFLTSCAHVFQVQFINPNNGAITLGTYDTRERTVSVILPSGETFKGNYYPLLNSSLSYGSIFTSKEIANFMAINTGISKGYALLKGDWGNIMEAVFEFNGRSGLGNAKTNTGEEYRIVF